MDRLKNIVVGVDFSRFSQVALGQAVRMARRNQAKLHVIHVIEDSVVSDLREALDVEADPFHEEVRAAALQRLNDFIAETGPQEIDLSVEVAIGVPLQLILQRVQDVKADLLAVGMKGTSGRSIRTGTLATKCVRKAATRVMLVHENQPETFTSVVACVDFSEVSERVVKQAVRAAVQNKAALHVMHAFYPPWKVLHYMAPTRQAAPDYQEQYRQNLKARLEQLLEPFRDETRDLEVQCHLVEISETAEAIMESKKEFDADLIVLGTRGRTRLKTLLLGTTAERIIQEAWCSVLAIKPEGFEYSVD